MATPGSFVDGVIAAIIGIFLSVVLMFGIAVPAEKFIAIMEGTTVYDIPSKWMAYDNVLFWMNLMYIVIAMPALIGLITMFLSAIKTQEYDVISDEVPPSAQYIQPSELQFRR